jgi:hypothetical protein
MTNGEIELVFLALAVLLTYAGNNYREKGDNMAMIVCFVVSMMCFWALWSRLLGVGN